VLIDQRHQQAQGVRTVGVVATATLDDHELELLSLMAGWVGSVSFRSQRSRGIIKRLCETESLEVAGRDDVARQTAIR
jgi:hypothetical protein